MGSVSPTRTCAWCRNPLRRKQRRYCSRHCATAGATAALNAERIAEGRICEHCRKPLKPRQKRFCCSECRGLATRKPKVCCICLAKYVGPRKTCSSACATKLIQKLRTTLLNARWRAARFEQPGLETLPTTAYLMRRPLTTASGRPVVVICWRSGQVVDFPADPDVNAVLWREGNSVFCEARRQYIARAILRDLTSEQMAELPEKPLLNRFRREQCR